MSVFFSYIAVILIWSTTPLAIKLSNDSLSSHAAVMSRMGLAFIVVAIVVSTWKSNAVLKRQNWKVYIAAGFGIFPNMSFVYIAANYIPSGMIAVIFALNPLFAGAMASIVLKENFFSLKRILAIICAFCGLFIIFYEQLNLDANSWIGICLILLSTLCFSTSQVLVKLFQQQAKVDAVEQTLGSLCFALPGLVALWYIFDGSFPQQISATSVNAIIYLAVIGTVLGFYAYFYVLSNLSVTLVSAIPLTTPVLALWMGAYFVGEKVTPNIMFGTALILLALLLYGQLITLVMNRAKNLIRA